MLNDSVSLIEGKSHNFDVLSLQFMLETGFDEPVIAGDQYFLKHAFCDETLIHIVEVPLQEVPEEPVDETGALPSAVLFGFLDCYLLTGILTHLE
jgi:hypothetical protein